MTFRLQTELATRPDTNSPAVPQSTSATQATVSDPNDVSSAGVPEDRQDILKTNPVVPGVHYGSAYPHPIASDKPVGDHTIGSGVHHRMSKSQEDSSDRYRAVSITFTCPSTRSDSSLLSPMPGECPQLAASPMRNNLRQAHPENLRPRHLRRCLQFTRKFNTPSPEFGAKSKKYNRR